MPLTTQALDDLGDLMFLHVDAVNYGDAAGLQVAATEGSCRLSLATVDYVVGDTLMTADEAAYTSYVRPTVVRSGSGWTSVNGAIANAALIVFGEKSGGGDETEVAFGLSFLATGDYLQWFGGLAVDRLVSNGTNPQFLTGALDLTLT